MQCQRTQRISSSFLISHLSVVSFFLSSFSLQYVPQHSCMPVHGTSIRLHFTIKCLISFYRVGPYIKLIFLSTQVISTSFCRSTVPFYLCQLHAVTVFHVQTITCISTSCKSCQLNLTRRSQQSTRTSTPLQRMLVILHHY